MEKNPPKKKSKKLNQAYSNNVTIQQFNNVLLFAFILLLPTQLGKYYFFDFSYISGVRVDYLAPTIYLTDVIALLLFVLNFRYLLNLFKQKNFLLFFFLILINCLFSIFPPLSLYRSLKILEFIVIYLVFRRAQLRPSLILSGFLITGLVELLLSGFQLANRHSLQGLFYFMGERPLGLSLPGIAKTSLNGIELLRPYGTFSHPNSLAGFYLLVYFFVITSGQKINFVLKNFSLLVFSLLIFLSFSKITIFAYLILNLIYLWRSSLKKDCKICFLSRLTVFFLLSLTFLQAKSDPFSWQKRVALVRGAFTVISRAPFFGAGLGNYLLTQNGQIRSYPDFLNQPVHNIFLLLAAELGTVLSLILLLLLWRRLIAAIKSNPYLLLVLVLTGLFDHYWITLQQNFLLIPVVMAAAFRRSKF